MWEHNFITPFPLYKNKTEFTHRPDIITVWNNKNFQLKVARQAAQKQTAVCCETVIVVNAITDCCSPLVLQVLFS